MQFVNHMPQIYLSPRKDRNSAPGQTHYQVFTSSGRKEPGAPFLNHPKDPFRSKQGPTFAGITDGMTNTLMIVEAAEPVPWTKPDDLLYEPDQPLPRMGGFFDKGFNAAFFDASVRFVNTARASDRVLRLVIQHRDGLVIPMEELEPQGGAPRPERRQEFP
jgi:hypothetical protein